MRYIKQVLIGVIIIMVTVVITYKFFSNSKLNNDTQSSVEKQVEKQNFVSQINSEGAVEVTVKPLDLSERSKAWDFEVVLSTHSVELNEDLVKASILIVDGKEYKPVSWEGPGPGGHHREGVLVFNAINPVSAYVELRIKDVGGIAERTFKWNLE